MSHERDSGVYYTGEVTRIATNKHKNKFNVKKIQNSRMGSKYDKTLKKVQCVRISSRFRNEFDSIAYFGIDWVPECRVRDSGIVWGESNCFFFLVSQYGIFLTGNEIAPLVNSYSPKWRWLALKRRGKYPPLATDTEVNSCFSAY